jgi:MscS family membrane protein
VDISAYLFVRDWNEFLEIQETLLFEIMNIVRTAGTDIALPSRTLYLAGDTSDTLTNWNRSIRSTRG